MNEAARLMCDLALDPSLRDRYGVRRMVFVRYTLSAERAAIADGSGDAMLAPRTRLAGGAQGMQAVAQPRPVAKREAFDPR